MKKLLIMIGLLIFTLIPIVYAANTINEDGGVIDILIVDADWLWSTTLPATGVQILSIDYIPAATDEICVIKNGSDTGPRIFEVTSADIYDDRTKDFHGKLLKPVFDYSDSTNSAGGRIIIILK